MTSILSFSVLFIAAAVLKSISDGVCGWIGLKGLLRGKA